MCTERLVSFSIVTFLSYNRLLPSAHASIVRLLRSAHTSVGRSFISCRQARSAAAQLEHGVSFIHLMLFSCFSPQSLGLVGGGARPYLGSLSSPPLRVWPGPAGTQPPCPFGFGGGLFCFCFVLWLLLFVPAHLFWFISRFGPGRGADLLVRALQPLPCGDP